MTDDDEMPFGKHRGRAMRDVPAEYLDWLRDQDWVEDWPQVAEYLRKNKAAIDAELRP